MNVTDLTKTKKRTKANKTKQNRRNIFINNTICFKLPQSLESAAESFFDIPKFFGYFYWLPNA